MSREKVLDVDRKAVYWTIGQLKNTDGINADGTQYMFAFTILENINETRLNFFSRKCNSLIKDSKLSRSKS